ncbi:MAG: folate-binding protein YgfZ [Ahrensia sp.]|nr:folate-binding protein YgfZ [Ahrensia sp.]
MPVHFPSGRSLISVSAEEATHFLQNLITCDVEKLPEGIARPGALLTPQGKILFDFLIVRDGDGYLIDIDSRFAGDFLKRLTMYKLRAKVTISESDESLAAISWETDSTLDGGRAVRDGRFPEDLRVMRHYGGAASGEDDAEGWTALRIAHGVAESGSDFEAGDAFPHDVSLDQNTGVDFRKGCFVGQEVVSRMQHRGTARRRLVIASADGTGFAPGDPLEAGGKTVGALGSVAGGSALALVRLDRAKDAMDAGTPITANGRNVTLSLPPNVGYRWPEETAD